ncbi:MAG: hypothetical protein AAB599_01440 [Patescibacteria group bacterium]
MLSASKASLSFREDEKFTLSEAEGNPTGGASVTRSVKSYLVKGIYPVVSGYFALQLQVLKRVSALELAQTYGISVKTIYGWLKVEYHKQGKLA